MSNICSKIKSIFITMVVFIFSIPSKIFADLNPDLIEGSGVEVGELLYGPPKSDTTISKWKFFIIPIIFIIGAVVYFKKSKRKTKQKIALIILALVILLIVAYAIYKATY